MISRMSKSIALFFARKNIISREEIDSYIYGFQFILSAALSWSIILLIMILTRAFPETALYILSVIVLRHHTGGYHASTPLKCCIMSVSAYISVLLILHISTASLSIFGSMAILLISLILIMKLAPIVHKNNPVKPGSLKRHRLYSIVYSSLFACMAIVFILLKYYNLALVLSLGMLQVSISLLIEKRTHEKEV